MGDLLLPANAWSSLTSVAEADSASTVTFLHPAIANVAGQLHALFHPARDGQRRQRPRNVLAPNHRRRSRRPMVGARPARGQQRPGRRVPIGFRHPTSGSRRHRASGTPAAETRAKSPSSVVSAKYLLAPGGSTATVTLDATPARPSALALGATLELTPGYASGTAGAAEYGVSQSFTISHIRSQSYRGRGTIAITAVGAWGALERWHAPQAWQTAASLITRAGIFERIARRAGIDVASAQLAAHAVNRLEHLPASVRHRRRRVRRQYRPPPAVVPDFVRDTASNGTMEVAGLTPSDPVTAYGGSGEITLLALAIDEAERPANWLRVQGPRPLRRYVRLPRRLPERPPPQRRPQP